MKSKINMQIYIPSGFRRLRLGEKIRVGDYSFLQNGWMQKPYWSRWTKREISRWTKREISRWTKREISDCGICSYVTRDTLVAIRKIKRRR